MVQSSSKNSSSSQAGSSPAASTPTSTATTDGDDAILAPPTTTPAAPTTSSHDSSSRASSGPGPTSTSSSGVQEWLSQLVPVPGTGLRTTRRELLKFLPLAGGAACLWVAGTRLKAMSFASPQGLLNMVVPPPVSRMLGKPAPPNPQPARRARVCGGRDGIWRPVVPAPWGKGPAAHLGLVCTAAHMPLCEGCPSAPTPERGTSRHRVRACSATTHQHQHPQRCLVSRPRCSKCACSISPPVHRPRRQAWRLKGASGWPHLSATSLTSSGVAAGG